MDTGSRTYRQIIPMQRLLDAGVKEEMLRPQSRVWLGTLDKVYLRDMAQSVALLIPLNE